MSDSPIFHFDNSFARQMDGFYLPWVGEKAPSPEVLKLNTPLAEELGLDSADLHSPLGAAILAGSETPYGSEPLSMAYAGHQFGSFSSHLGDGRALLLGEIVSEDGKRRDLQLKGSGRTPFSRRGDGKAVIGPVLREYLFGEAMFALGIPSTRALAAVATGEMVERDGPQKGAVLARIAASHLRVGTFQFFAAREELDKLRQLAEYAIARHYPDLVDEDDRYLGLFRQVRDAQATLIARWVLVGFVHGVMNTDNVTISGETIDYGPCAFIDHYDPKAVFSSIDHHGRYAYGNQPNIGRWNLARFAETLVPLVDPDDPDRAAHLLGDELKVFSVHYVHAWVHGMRAKLGLLKELPDDASLANDLLKTMEGQNVDYTNLFRALSDLIRGNSAPARAQFDDPAHFDSWVERFAERSKDEDVDANARAAAMDRVNPVYIPRNHLVEEALAQANAGNMEPFDALLARLERPFETVVGAERYAEPAPASFGRHVTFCGT